MATKVVMPQAGQDLETGLVRRWLKAEGDLVAKGEPLVEVETEKLTLEVEAPATGILLRIIAADDTRGAGPVRHRRDRRSGRGHLGHRVR